MAETLVSYDPRTNTPNGSVDVTAPEEVPAAVERARKAFDAWGGTFDADARRPYLKQLQRVVLRRGQEIAEMVTAETGRPINESYAYDVLTTMVLIDHYRRQAHRMLRTERRSTWPFVSARGWVEYRPRGVAGVISPWNYPFYLPMVSVVTALAAGCTVVLKPSEITPLTGQIIADVVAEAGLPEGSVTVVQGGPGTGRALIDADIDVIAFTGSTAVGQKIATHAAERFIPAILELGGKDAMVVLADADVKRAAHAAVWGAMFNTGQTCVSVERVCVHESIYDRFLDEATRLIDEITESRKLGPVIHPPQLAVIERQIADAIDRGARLVRGGKRTETDGGTYFPPTILVDLNLDMQIMQEETFGPVLAVRRFVDEDVAVQMANTSRYGLHGSVWSKDRRHAERIASRLDTGTVAINDIAVNFIAPSLPFGGVKQSGLGMALGPEGLHAYSHPKGVTEARTRWSTTEILGAWYPKPRGLRWWKAIGTLLFKR